MKAVFALLLTSLTVLSFAQAKSTAVTDSKLIEAYKRDAEIELSKQKIDFAYACYDKKWDKSFSPLDVIRVSTQVFVEDDEQGNLALTFSAFETSGGSLRNLKSYPIVEATLLVKAGKVSLPESYVKAYDYADVNEGTMNSPQFVNKLVLKATTTCESFAARIDKKK